MVELTFGGWMLIFSECWFDSLIIDVLMTNLPGMFMGFVIMKIMGINLYDWFGREGKKSI